MKPGQARSCHDRERMRCGLEVWQVPSRDLCKLSSRQSGCVATDAKKKIEEQEGETHESFSALISRQVAFASTRT